MSFKLTNELFQSARTVVREGQIKRSLEIKVENTGAVNDTSGEPLDILPLGNQGDHCVTEINFHLPTELQDGYYGYFLVDLENEIYIQKCEMLTEDNEKIANAWVEEKITFNKNKELNCLFVAIEADLDSGDNITEETEIFVTDEFYGAVQDNFLTSGWHAGVVVGDDITAGDIPVSDPTPGEDPTEYEPMVWVNGETKLNAENMNNIMLGIDEAHERLDSDVELKENKTLEITSKSTDEEYPSAKAAKDYVDNSIKAQKITYSALKSLRDSGELIPGQSYRITDYQCTTSQTNTSSAGHAFDIIVIADDVNVLNENARACLHDGDTYFANNDLSVWKLKYCIDNDTTRFAWADNTNGKGVIFWLKDEFNNECPYDFKNILFTKADAYTNVYTFTYKEHVFELKDASIVGISKGCYNNVIKEYYVSSKLQLNWNIFYSSLPNETLNCYSNTFGNDCYNNTFGGGCYYNTFGNHCYSNTFGNYCYSNTFGNDCSYNTFGNIGNNCSYNTFGDNCSHNTFDFACEHNAFGDDCYSNTFGAVCEYNTFSNYCYSNTFGNHCSYNTFGNDCYSNTFGGECSSNTFGNYCYSNTFDIECPYNTFGNHCYSNKFGKNCYSNTFGNDCHYNTFGIYCSYNTFGDDCEYNTFGTSSSAINYCRHIIFDNGCSYIYLSSEDTTASRSNRLQNVHIHVGVMGSSDKNRLSIVVPDRALTYSIDYYKSNSQNIILDD